MFLLTIEDECEEEPLEAHIPQKRARVKGVGAELVSGFRADESCESACGGGEVPSQQGKGRKKSISVTHINTE